MFRSFWKSIKTEIRHAIFSSWFHFVRFGGLLLIPLIYGFSYVFAFWDPFQKTGQLPIVVVTQQLGNKNGIGFDEKYDPISGITSKTYSDPFGAALADLLTQTRSTKVGDLEMTIQADHVYRDVWEENKQNADGSIGGWNQSKVDYFVDQEMNKYHFGFIIPNVTKEVDQMALSFVFSPKMSSTGEILKHIDLGNGTWSPDIHPGDPLYLDPNALIIPEAPKGDHTLNESLDLFTKLMAEKIQVVNNFKKNYLIAFGVDVGSSMSGMQKLMLSLIAEAFNSDTYRNHIMDLINKYYWNNPLSEQIAAGERLDKLTSDLYLITDALNFDQEAFMPVKAEAQMGEHAKYGFGLTPFFVSVAMWVGSMVMTFAVHKKVYDKSIGPVMRYFSKWLLIAAGTIVQATILMFALYWVGLDKLGNNHWGYMYGFAIFTGLIFGTIVQAIRFIVPSRILGILLSVLLLILQMASAGGLFPIETQAPIYKALNILLPMGHTVKVYRELAFETRWEVVWEHIGVLLIYPALFLPFGLHLNKISTIKWYRKNHSKLPESVTHKDGGDH